MAAVAICSDSGAKKRKPVTLSLVSISVLCLVAWSCPALFNPMDCSPPESSVHALQESILEWVTMPSSRGSSQSRDRTLGSCTAGRFFTVWASREATKFLSLHENIPEGVTRRGGGNVGQNQCVNHVKENKLSGISRMLDVGGAELAVKRQL